ncbi:MAG: hypothetical protein F6K14_14325 [Symploca sp. SIO2C1]|nr:hypothetical protein [Symploca sp. SIO2C1]
MSEETFVKSSALEPSAFFLETHCKFHLTHSEASGLSGDPLLSFLSNSLPGVADKPILTQ